MAAYELLENQGVIEARPQSGYYVRARLEKRSLPTKPRIASKAAVPRTLSIDDYQRDAHGFPPQSDLVPLGGAVPDPELLPVDRLTRTLSAVTRRFKHQSVSYDVLPGARRCAHR